MKAIISSLVGYVGILTLCIVLLIYHMDTVEKKVKVLEDKTRIITDTSTTYYNGKILFPDYVHDDTLIVTNMELLNDGIDNVETDADINSLLIKTTRKYSKQLQLQRDSVK